MTIFDSAIIPAMHHLPIIVLASFLGFLFPADAQTIKNASYSTVAHIKDDGTIQDAAYKTIGHIKPDGTVQDASYTTIRHLKSDGTVQDASYKTIGHAPSIPLSWAAYYFFFSD